nr:unnamed protein product [Spodoptera littoralis]
MWRMWDHHWELVIYIRKIGVICGLNSSSYMPCIDTVYHVGPWYRPWYNYCYVDLKVVKPGSSSGSRRSGQELDETSLETQDFRRNMETTAPLPQRTVTLPTIKATMQIPLNGEIDLAALFSKLRGRNRNVTLELVT